MYMPGAEKMTTSGIYRLAGQGNLMWILLTLAHALLGSHFNLDLEVRVYDLSSYAAQFKRCLGLSHLTGLTAELTHKRRAVIKAVWNVAVVAGETYQMHEETACEGESVTIRCLSNDLIQVQMARYGRIDDRICSSDTSHNIDIHCGLHDTTSNVTEKCNDKSECVFTVGPAAFTDPCPRTKKYLQVMWECVPFAVGCPGVVSGLSARQEFATTSLKDNAAWVRDPFQQTDKIYYMALSPYGNPALYEFANPNAMVSNKPITFNSLPDRIDGTGFVVYDGCIYYNKERSRIVGKYSLRERRVVAEKELPKANYHGTSPYAVLMDTDIDLAIDESGLWAIYATEANDGNIVLSRIERHTLTILSSWQTSYPKLSALNAFVVCGVLYVVNYDTLNIDYMFNTTSNSGKKLNIVVPSISSTTSAIEYNPKDRLLYVWDMKSAITYRVEFAPPEEPVHKTTTTSTVSVTTTTPTKSSTANSVNPGPPVRPVITTTPPTVTPGINVCFGGEASGVMWQDTAFTKMAVMPCPGVGGGQAIWICGGNSSSPAWQTGVPDLSQCSSRWIKDLISELEVGVTSIVDLSISLVQQLREKESELTSWDIAMIIKFYRMLLDQAINEPRNAATLTDSVVKTSSILLSPTAEPVWRALRPRLQTQLAAALGKLVEDVAFLLGQDVTMDDGAATAEPTQSFEDYPNMIKLNWVESHVSLGIRVLTSHAVMTQSQTKVISWKNSNGDAITVESKAILESLEQNVDKFTTVLLAFERLGTYMQEAAAYPANTFTVNSQIVSMSVASVKDKVFNRVKHPLQLKRPLYVTFQHNKESEHLACAYWSEHERDSRGVWSERGCRRLSGNSTQSVCKCEHMTSFVVLSSSYAFGGETNPPTATPREPGTLPYTQYINLVRSGVVISLVFSVVVAITLLLYSKKMDLNTIHKNIMITLCISEVVFLCGVQHNSPSAVCLIVAVLLHYFVLCVFTWSTMGTYHLLLLLGDLVVRNDRWRWYYVIGYTCPGVVVGVSSAVKYSKSGALECWLKNDDGSFWGIIAPCCFLICLCVIFLGMALRKLSTYQINATEKKRLMRSRAIRSSILLLLLCAAWSFGLMWFSGVASQLTAILFCIFSAGYGIVSFLFYCLLSREIRKMYSKCIPGKKKSTDRSYQHRFSGLPMTDQMPAECNTMHTNIRTDGTACTVYRYQTGGPVTGTTMLPVANAQSIRLAKAAAAMDHSESLPLCRRSGDMSPDLLSHHHPTARARCTRASECDCLLVADDTDPKLPSQSLQPRPAMWNDYYQPHHTINSCNSNKISEGQPMAPDHHLNPQQYEQPTHYCHCTQVSGASSGCYDHLHEEPGARSRKQGHCQSCYYQVSAHAANQLHPGRNPHLYETMGPFLPEGESASCAGGTFQSCPTAMPRRHCYEDVSMHRVDMTTGENGQTCFCRSRSSCLHHDRQVQNVQPPVTRSADNSFERKPESLPLVAPCPMYRTDPSAGRRVEKHNRSGRHSDPLSTDQGYDTDSQQQVIMSKQKDNGMGKPHFTSLIVTDTTSASHASLNDGVHCHRNPYPSGEAMRDSSGSVASDCPSENDREVELIINASSSPNRKRNSAGLRASATDVLPNTTVTVADDRSALDDADGIDTATGGCLSAYGTAASWSAVAASDPRINNAHQPSRQIAMGEPKQGGSERFKPETVQGGEQSSLGANPCTYTLPGTAQAGTKARIDLRSGGISMITNL